MVEPPRAEDLRSVVAKTIKRSFKKLWREKAFRKKHKKQKREHNHKEDNCHREKLFLSMQAIVDLTKR